MPNEMLTLDLDIVLLSTRKHTEKYRSNQIELINEKEKDKKKQCEHLNC